MGNFQIPLESNAPEIAKGIGNIVPRQLSLRKALDEQKMGQQTMQMNELKIAEEQRKQAEQQAIQQAYTESGGDIDKFFQIAPSKNISPETLLKLQESITQYKKSKLDLSHAEWQQEQDKNNTLSQALDAIASVPVDVQPAAWDRAMQQLMGQGKLTPEESEQYRQYPGPDGIKQMSLARKTSDQINEQIRNERAAAAEKREQEEFDARKAAGNLGGDRAGSAFIQKYEAYVKLQEAELGRKLTPAEAKQAWAKVQADERASTLNDSDRLLSPNEAGTLDVPYGTTRAGAAGREAKTVDQRNKEVARGKVEMAIGALEDLGKKVITEKNAAIQRAKATGRAIETVLGDDPDFRAYQASRMALAGNLAVAQQGSRPSDADIRSIWLPLVPDAFKDTIASSAALWQMIRINAGLEESAGDDEKVTVTNPQGQRGRIPKSQLADALAQGYKEVK